MMPQIDTFGPILNTFSAQLSLAAQYSDALRSYLKVCTTSGSLLLSQETLRLFLGLVERYFTL